MILAICLSSCAVRTLGPFYVNNRYGDPAPYGFHPGIDFAINSGAPIIAVSNGKVILLRETNADGDEVVIIHGKHFISNYAHLSKVFVRKDQFVKRGQLIALSGASNNYNRPNYEHLHFGICKIGRGGCRDQSDTHDPNLFWLGGQPQCFDPKMDYSAFSQKDITLPIACGDYGKALIAESKGKDSFQ
jgi:murein DD-endopeptidase MepM/ murein hydrolase activator NlpD